MPKLQSSRKSFPFEYYSQNNNAQEAGDRMFDIVNEVLKTTEDIPQYTDPENALDKVYDLYDRTINTSRNVDIQLTGDDEEKFIFGATAKLFETDQKHAKELLRILNTDPLYSRVDYREACYNRTLVRDVLEESTTRFLERLQIKEPEEGEESDIGLLNEFFDVCQAPNPAEVRLLALCLETDDEIIKKWFENKKAKSRTRIFASRYALCGDTPVISNSRNKMLDIQNGIARADGSAIDLVDPSRGAKTLNSRIVGLNKIED